MMNIYAHEYVHQGMLVKNEFVRQVRSDYGSDTSPEALHLAIEDYVRSGRLSREDIERCGELAIRLDAWHSARSTETGPELTPGLIATSEHLAEGIRSRVEQLRALIFERFDAPFPRTGEGLRSAAEWIESKAAEQARPTVTEVGAGIEKLSEARRLVSEAERLLCCEIDAPVQMKRLLRYVKPGKITKASTRISRCTVEVGRPPQTGPLPRAPLYLLTRTVHELANETGFSEPLLVMYVLNGLSPLLIPVVIEGLPEPTRPGALPTTPSPRRARVTFNAWDLTFDDLRTLYPHLRRQFVGDRRAKRLNEQHRALLDLVKELGGEPQRRDSVRGSRKVFWEGVAREWRHRHPRGRRAGPRAIELRYKRCLRAVSRDRAASGSV